MGAALAGTSESLSAFPKVPAVFLFADFKACREKEAQRHETRYTAKGYDHKASKEIDVT